jgi:hypothetical protein
MDRAFESALAQRRQVSAVVDVSMGENNGVHTSGGNGKIEIPLKRIAPPALIQPAIEQVSLAVRV